ncbi:sulfotransferase [Photobacterium sagamiensis]|uniref:sulfotransferase n=1 Tax=Photobacterium sagamiensis TaxID=2910241 RepID=UPI003D0B4AE4
MDRTYHFIAGLPRSGSTLLAGILRQPRAFYAAMSSPVVFLINSFLEQISANREFSSFFDAEKQKVMCHGLFHFYYSATPKRVIWDANRQWTAHMHQLVVLFDDFKVIFCVRKPAWVMDYSVQPSRYAGNQ